MTKSLILITVLSGSLLLQGCVAFALGTGAAVTAKTASDPRSLGSQVDDTTLDSRIGIALDNNRDYFKDARIVATAYNGVVLLTGQAQSQAQIDKAYSLASGVDGVMKVYNQIRLGPRIGGGTLTGDAWITTKVKSQLIGNSATKARNIKVVTENSEVFLMGLVTAQEAKAATQVASKVAGVKLVVAAFEIVQ
ncbi:division/outer membrane stress-associated lipid-binding lipoprotein [Utexia brackfieldae]|uniref:division/outer membrane stress-associated lipid-binding lipoprotein n=1 Tax=Utexia brackfieldae TaxID=3074108 RepID=UPI00370D0C8A